MVACVFPMSVKWLFVVWQLMEIVISAQETQTEEPLTTGNGLLFLLSCAVALIGGCSASLAFTFYLDWSRAALDEQLEQRTGYLNKTRTKLSEQRVKLVQLIREEAELFEMEHQAETRIQNDRKLHEREFGRKAKEAEKAKRVVGYAAARNHIHQIDDAETLALRGRLQQERNAMAESIRKKLNRATHAREQVTQRAREEAQKDSVAIPKRTAALTSMFRRRPAARPNHAVIDQSQTEQKPADRNHFDLD